MTTDEKLAELEERIKKLEGDSHPPVDIVPAIIKVLVALGIVKRD